jgi:hypothetical protein
MFDKMSKKLFSKDMVKFMVFVGVLLMFCFGIIGSVPVDSEMASDPFVRELQAVEPAGKMSMIVLGAFILGAYAGVNMKMFGDMVKY